MNENRLIGTETKADEAWASRCRESAASMGLAQMNAVEWRCSSRGHAYAHDLMVRNLIPVVIQVMWTSVISDDAFVQFVNGFAEQFPQLHVEVKRVIAEGDLVMTHSLLTTSNEDRGTAAADIFHLENGKIVEHWDVLQAVPESAANDNTMF